MNDFAVGFATITEEKKNALLAELSRKLQISLSDLSMNEESAELDFLPGVIEIIEFPVGGERPVWDKKKFEYKSKKGTQYLAVTLHDKQRDGTGEPQYHFDSITCQQGSLVKAIYIDYSPWPPKREDELHPLVKLPEGTTTLLIEFKMPGHTRTEKFDFSVYVRRRGTMLIHDADPQAGNDPPGLPPQDPGNGP